MSWLGKLFGNKPDVMPEHVEDAESFRRVVLESKLPVILDVWSETCAPCRALEPVLIDVATRHRGRVVVAEINSNTGDPELLEQLDVRATPTILIFDGGVELGRVAGYHPRSWFDEMIAAEFPPETR